MARLARAEQREETRRRLIDSAAGIFSRVGFEAAPIDVIAEGAGFSRGAFYSNFESKDELFLILLERHINAEIETLDRSLARVQVAADLAAVIERRYRVLGEDSSWCLLTTEFQLYTMRGGKKADEFADIYQRYRERLGTIMDKTFTRLEISSDLSPYEFGVSLIALAHGLALQRLSNDSLAATLPARALGTFTVGALAPHP